MFRGVITYSIINDLQWETLLGSYGCTYSALAFFG